MRSLHDCTGQDVERLVAVVAVPTANQVIFLLTLYVLGRTAQGQYVPFLNRMLSR